MIPITPGMIKGGAVALLLSTVFYGGCAAQNKLNSARLNKLKSDYTRLVGIIDTFQDNVDTLNMAIKDQNEATIELGRKHDEKVSSINALHNNAIARLNAANNAAIRVAEEEAAALRRRMVGLSVGEACHEAWLEVIQ